MAEFTAIKALRLCWAPMSPDIGTFVTWILAGSGPVTARLVRYRD